MIADINKSHHFTHYFRRPYYFIQIITNWNNETQHLTLCLSIILLLFLTQMRLEEKLSSFLCEIYKPILSQLVLTNDDSTTSLE